MEILDYSLEERPLTEAAFQEAERHLPGGVNSPVRAWKGLGLTPLVISHAERDLLYDLDGRAYIDFCSGFGALIHGHGYPPIVRAASEQLVRGVCYGLTSESEIALARQIKKHLPSIEKVRFLSSGTEATMSALRLARAATGRKYFVKFSGNYHGHADPFLVSAGSSLAHLPKASSQGVPRGSIETTLVLPFNDVEAVESLFLKEGKEIAAVIVEPVAANMGLVLPESRFLSTLRALTMSYGALLIFDEVITGFRVGLKGAQGHFGVVPDLTTLGKVVGGGFNVAAFGGRSDLMDLLAPLGAVFQAGTLSGSPVAMAAGLESLVHLERSGLYSELEKKTIRFLAPIEKRISERNLPIAVTQMASLFTLFFGLREPPSNFEAVNRVDSEAFKRFFHHMLARGVYLSPSPYEVHFLSLAHTEEHLAHAQSAILDFLDTY